MDPVSQGVVGAALPQSTHRKSQFLVAGFFGLVGGMVPDLDTLIRSDHDPLLYLEFHRQFTHSLIFIPFGGLICAAILHLVIGKRQSMAFWQTYLFCTLGYATHGLLDAMTSYGTMLFWPFSDARIALSYISIVDPLFTLPVLVLVGLSAWRGSARYARLAMVWGLLYLGLGAYQNHRAITIGNELATSRGHQPVNLGAKPSFGNLLVWKLIYRHEDRYYVDAVRVGIEPSVYPGTSIKALNVAEDFPWLDPNSQQAKDIERFRWFSKGYIAKDPNGKNQIIDLRYSFIPNRIDGLWSIALSPKAQHEDHADFVTFQRADSESRKMLWSMICCSKSPDSVVMHKTPTDEAID